MPERYRLVMVFWLVVGALVAVLLAAMWRMDRTARRRGARVTDSGTIGRNTGRSATASPYGYTPDGNTAGS